MKQTTIHPVHQRREAKMADFRGWQTPSRFTTVAEEHQAVRLAAGLFDIGYLGRIAVSGPAAAELLQKVFTRNIESVPEGSASFGLLCNEAGGILSDAILFHLPPESGDQPRFLLTTGPDRTDAVREWLTRHGGKNVSIEDRTAQLAHFAVQGPESLPVVDGITAARIKKIRPHAVRDVSIGGIRVIVLRAGFMGEDGYELILPAEHGEAVWNKALESGREAGIVPCGLECRETLRVEAGRPLFGNDLDETRTPFEAGLDAFIDLRKEFIGSKALRSLRESGVKQRLTGFVLTDRVLPRIGGNIFSENHEIGTITSGVLSPSLRMGIGMGYVENRYAKEGQEVDVEVKDREIGAKIVKLPFYRKK